VSAPACTGGREVSRWTRETKRSSRPQPGCSERADWRHSRLAILGGGNIGLALARGLVSAGRYSPDRITITRRQACLLEDARAEGYAVHTDNHEAVRGACIVVLAVQPQQLEVLLRQIRGDLVPAAHVLISLVSGVAISEIERAVRLRHRLLPAVHPRGIAGWHRDRVPSARSAPARVPDRQGGGLAAAQRARSPGIGDRQGDDPARLHDRGAEPDGARGLQLGDDHGDHDVGRQGRSPVRAEG
jgi:hypothetical protein